MSKRTIRYVPHPDDEFYVESVYGKEYLEIPVVFAEPRDGKTVITKVKDLFTVKDNVLLTVDGYVQYHPVFGDLDRVFRKERGDVL